MGAAVVAQERLQKAGSFDGFSADGKLAEATRLTAGYYGCESAKNYMPVKLAAGDVVAPYRTGGDWTCAHPPRRRVEPVNGARVRQLADECCC